MAMAVYGLTIFFVSGAESALCSSRTVGINIASIADVQNLPSELACTGEGSFNITWSASLMIERRIEVTDGKNVTVTGAGFARIRGTLSEDIEAGNMFEDGRGTGIFSVTNGSTLRLNNLVLEGGNAQGGGAVDVLSSSLLLVLGCTFTSNSASVGGEPACLRHIRARWSQTLAKGKYLATPQASN